jgi:hypothetical protein
MHVGYPGFRTLRKKVPLDSVLAPVELLGQSG